MHGGVQQVARITASCGTRLIPGFGLIANLICMAFYVAGPFFNLGTKMEPLTALGIAGIWGIYGAIYFLRSSKAKGKSVLLTSKETA